MKTLKKKGFTIVELVIVVAVVAILAAVLIPTFSSLVKKANMSSDEVAVKNMNTVLALEEVDEEFSSIADVYRVLKEAGFKAENYRPLTDGATFYWIPELNRIVLYDETLQKILYPKNLKDGLVYDENSWISLIFDENRIFRDNAPVAALNSLPVGEDLDFSIDASREGIDLSSIDQCQVIKAFTPVDQDGDNFASQLDIYENWLADFSIILDDDFKLGSGGICGYYDLYGSWVFMVIDEISDYPGYNSEGQYYEAGTEFSLMQLLGLEGIPYDMIVDACLEGDAFVCGAFNYSNENIGKSITVQLRIYETIGDTYEKTGKYIVCNEIICEFDSVKNGK